MIKTFSRQLKTSLRRTQIRPFYYKDLVNSSRTISLADDAAVLTCEKDMSVQSCAELMAMAKVGSFLVSDASRKVYGIVTERDILRSMGSSWARLSAGKLLVKDIMTPANRIVMCSNHDSRDSIMKAMDEANIRHMVVGTVDGHTVTACLSLRDLVRDVIQGKDLSKGYD